MKQAARDILGDAVGLLQRRGRAVLVALKGNLAAQIRGDLPVGSNLNGRYAGDNGPLIRAGNVLADVCALSGKSAGRADSGAGDDQSGPT